VHRCCHQPQGQHPLLLLLLLLLLLRLLLVLLLLLLALFSAQVLTADLQN
jgi:hypothetical protein